MSVSDVVGAGRVSIDDTAPDVWVVRIENAERRNAMSRAVIEGLREAVARVAKVPSVRAVILCSAGEKAFCAGADLKERKTMSEAEVRAWVPYQGATLRSIETSPKVWIAALQGAALGGGLELALCCDLRVARRDLICGFPEARLGIIPGAGGTQRLPRLIGQARAKELILTGARVGAEEALRLGLVHRVADDHLEGARALAEQVARCAPISLAQAKRAIDEGLHLDLEAALAHERRCYEVTIPTRDRVEGLRAFAEKRAPDYIGE